MDAHFAPAPASCGTRRGAAERSAWVDRHFGFAAKLQRLLGEMRGLNEARLGCQNAELLC